MTEQKKRNLSIIFSVIGIVVLAAILIGVNKFTAPTYMLRTVLQLGAIYALVAVSMNLLNGFTGLFSLGQAGFMALGAYVFAIFTIPVSQRPGVYYLYGVADWLANIELPIVAALIVAGIACAIMAALIGAPVLRLKSDYFAIATLGFAEIVRIVVGSSPMNRITNGSMGLKLIPRFPDFYFPFIVVGVCIFIVWLLINSSYGRAFKAIREDEIAAEAMGINLAKHKQMSFIISSFFAGVGGALMAMYMGAITSTTFNVTLTYNILLIVVIGGMGSLTGSIISSFLVIAAREWWLRFLDQPLFIAGVQIPLFKTGFRMVVFSIILMIVVLFFRKGIMGTKEFNWNFLLKRMEKKKLQQEVTAQMDKKTILSVEDITMQFGGVVAVNNLTLKVKEGEIVSLIGPNGAGKTTAFNVITGVYAPTNGRITFHDKEIISNFPKGKMDKLYAGENKGKYKKTLEPTPDKITKLGIARTFQNIRLFKELTVLENVLIAKHMRMKANIFADTFRLNRKEELKMKEDSLELLRILGLYDLKDEIASSLPYGKQRHLEIARALATEPTLLLLDEPAAGLNPQETDDLTDFIRDVRDKFHLTIFMIEHHMNLVMDISDWIYVIDFGKQIANGTPEEIQHDQRVIDAYLGVADDE